MDDVIEPGNYWNSALVCCILGANPPLDIIKGFLSRIWKTYDIEDISFLKESQFIVRFAKEEDRDEILKRTYYFMDNKPVYVQKWYPGCKVDVMSRKDIPVWVQFLELEMKYWSLTGLSKHGSAIGKPVKRDKATASRRKWSYARILIEVQVNQTFPDQIHFLNEEGRIISQSVKYEWAPFLCSHCNKIGHEMINCRKKNPPTDAPKKPKYIWRPKDTKNEEKVAEAIKPTPVQVHTGPQNSKEFVSNEEERFIEVSKKKAARRFSLDSSDIYLEGIHDVWDLKHGGFLMYQVIQKLKLLKGPLRSLNRDKFQHLDKQVDILRTKLYLTQAALKNDINDENLLVSEKILIQELHLKLKAIYLLRKQQAKANWITFGDHDSKLFYAWVKKRKATNHLTSIKNTEQIIVEGKLAVVEVLVEFYQKQLGRSNPTEDINGEIIRMGDCLTIRQRLEIISPITTEEIRKCMFEIPNNKSPGPDGFSSGFFKSQWRKVGGLVTQAIQEFFIKEDTIKQINATNLVVIPKCEDPKSPTDLRPIACCNVIYKVIAKIICNRLKKVLPSIINLNQGAFVEGRELVHNVLLCQELARGYNRKNISPRCLMKLDLQKAYGNVSWKAIIQILTLLKFSSKFINWIKKYCVTTTSYSIHFAGENFGYFRGGKGIRQGDPISPLLFVIIMEYLSRAFLWFASKEHFGYHPMCKSLKLINIIFADDLIVACKADIKSITCIMRALQHFRDTTGLNINQGKSEIIFGGIKPQEENELLQLTKMRKGQLPFTYLGGPITSSRISAKDCERLIEKMTTKITAWTSKNLSYAGKCKLINSVLYGIIGFWCRLFVIPTKVMKLVQALCRNFLWGSTQERKRIPLGGHLYAQKIRGAWIQKSSFVE
ncbi:unnamed protein product [Cuscuta campestris]|uniref:Reverse transcriptase domain-containing protein n=1 Tax=Cuscuta campestris TaxID=132261 RepID=A0A484NIS2_9ASTE|nr:unnamed protein product [Cuscuta campestris]